MFLFRERSRQMIMNSEKTRHVDLASYELH